MGKLVAFWSPYAGRAKVTSSLCAVAGMFGAEYPEYRIAISHIGSDCAELGEKLDYRYAESGNKEIFDKSGISSLKLNFRQATLTKDKVRKSAIQLSMRSLFFYPNVEEKQYDELTHYLLTEVITEEFDAIFLDLKSGLNIYSEQMLEAVEIVIIVLPQEPRAWEDFLLHKEEYLSGKDYLVLFGGYLVKSKFSGISFHRKRKMLQGKLLGVIPVNTVFFDVMAEGRTLDFFYKNQLVRKKEENYEFIFQTKKVAETLRKYIFLSGTEDENTANVPRLHRDAVKRSGVIGKRS